MSDLIRPKTHVLPPETPGGRAPASPPPAFRFDLQRALSMHRRLAVVAAVTTFVLVMAFGLTRKVTYRSEAIFYVPPVTQELLPQGTSPSFDAGRYDSTFQQIIQTIQRPDTLMAAVRSLPQGVWRYPGEPLASAAARLAGNLNVQRVGTSYQLSVTLTGPRATEVAQTLDAVSKQFLHTMRQDESGITDEQVELLKAEQTRVQSGITQLIQEQSKLGAVLGVARLTADQPNPFDTSVEALRKQIEDIRHARDLAVAQVSINNGGGSGGESGGNTTTSGLIYGLNTRKATLQSQMSGMTPANPIYQQDQAELQSLDRELSAATRRYHDETNQIAAEQRDTTVRRVDGLEAQLRRELARQTELAVTAGPKLQRYAQLSAELTRLQTRAGVLDETVRTRTLEASGPNHVHMAVPPSVPSLPIPGKRSLVLLAALPLAFFAGIFAAVFAHNRDRRVFLGSDLEHVLGFRPMVVLPVPSEVSEPVSNGYMLRLAAGIENAYRNNGARTFLFTAPNLGTDVEELVFKLQSKLKELGYSVLWIGADTLLRAERDFEEAYGRGPSMGLEGYGNGTSGVATARLAWLTQDYDMVLIDAQPLTSSAETEYAIRRTDATILVNESGVTTRDDLQSAGELLEHIGLGSIGAVIKDLHLRDADPAYRIMVQDAERVSARPVHRQPRDNSGEWQILNPGSPDELRLPGDPKPGVYARRTRESILRERAATVQRAQSGSHGIYTATDADGDIAMFRPDQLHEDALSS